MAPDTNIKEWTPALAASISASPDAMLSVPIEGMTCASCVRRVERAIAAVPGVASATVNLATERAEIRFDGTPDLPAVLGAVSQAGYGVGTEATDLAIEGMTCASCVGRVERALKAVPGVTEAAVNLATNRARVTHLPAVGAAALVAAVQAAGYGAERIGAEAPPTVATASAPPARPRFAAWCAASASLRCSPCRWWCWRWARTCRWPCTTPSATASASR